jgi:hypothetical protein
LNKSNLVAIGLIVAAILAIFWWKSQKQSLPEPVPKAEAQTNQASPNKTLPAATAVTNREEKVQTTLPDSATPEERKMALADLERKLAAALATPITFYGKVVDQSNQPIAGVEISYETQDKFGASGSNYHGASDENGMFSISNIRGASLYVGAGKEGYYSRNKSYGTFNYAGNPNPPPPTRDNPAIFVLVKMGETEPLVPVDRDVLVPKDGTPVNVDLATGKAVSAGKGNFQVQCWTHDEDKKPNQQLEYAWNCKVTVPGGGLQYRTNEFEFEAPLEGYYQSDEMGMPQLGVRWNAHIKRNYFLKLGDGRYARIQLEMVAAGGHFVSIETYLNPISGHRNLEFDSKKAIK